MLNISCNLLTTILKVRNRMVVDVLIVYPHDDMADWELWVVALPSITSIISYVTSLKIKFHNSKYQSVQLLICDPMDCSTSGLPVHHQLPEITQTHVHWVSDAIQLSHPLSSPSLPTFNLSQHQGLFKWVSSSHHAAKVLEFQLQHQSFQWILRTDFL